MKTITITQELFMSLIDYTIECGNCASNEGHEERAASFFQEANLLKAMLKAEEQDER